MIDSNGSTASKQPTELTVDEMLAIYPRAHVEAAIYYRNYKAGRNQTLQRFKDLIAQGINVESCAAGMKDVEDTTPPAQPHDPAEPSNLHRDVLWRIIALKYTYRDGCEHDTAQSINLNAILDAYRTGHLKVVENETTVWFGGRLTMGPLPDSELKPADYIDKIPEWTKMYGPGRVWVEQPTKNSVQRLNAGVIPPASPQQHHVFSIRARLIEATSFVVLHNILDDTGSDVLEMYGEDCRALGLSPNYPYWGQDVVVDTSNGRVRRLSFYIAAQLLSANGQPLGPVVLAEAAVIPQIGGNTTRTSGMFFREGLFTATCPFGNGNLYLSDRKPGVTRPLPAS